MPTALRQMPDAVRDLRAAWPSLASTIPDLTAELEREFRFGQRITKTERGYIMGGTLKGGSSSMWFPVERKQYQAFRRWQTREGVLEGRDDEAQARLAALLARHEVELVTRRGPPKKGAEGEPPNPAFGPLYGLMLQVLEALPVEHLARPALRRIQLGGWGPDAAKASAYDDGAVLMYDFACRGARRTFLGLFLHELGHAHEVSLAQAELAALGEAWRVLVDEDAFVGVEFILDAPTRCIYQRLVFAEFLAETYMLYAAMGEALRGTIEGLAPRARDAWRRVYELFRSTFHGVEYA
jgi:hypothetical protein